MTTDTTRDTTRDTTSATPQELYQILLTGKKLCIDLRTENEAVGLRAYIRTLKSRAEGIEKSVGADEFSETTTLTSSIVRCSENDICELTMQIVPKVFNTYSYTLLE
jgi:hypothetical protein